MTEKFDSDNIRRQLGAKKLSLVLDLDHTLLHAVRVSDVVGEIPTTGSKQYTCMLTRWTLMAYLMHDQMTHIGSTSLDSWGRST